LAVWKLTSRDVTATPSAATAGGTAAHDASAPAGSAAVAPAASAPPVAAPAPQDFATLLRNSAAVTDLDGAYSRLFALWSARYVAGSEDACSQALRQGLECLNETGGIDALRRYNRPALLALEDDTGAVHQTIVVRLQGDTARLLVGAGMHDVALPDLKARWDGEFQMLWRPPQLDARSLAMGNQGESVRVLRARLRQWAGLPADSANPDVFDEELRSLVMQFQRRNGLAADGIAGTRTQALLDAALATTDSPLLSALAP
jgi:general secretion pathway protein A